MANAGSNVRERLTRERDRLIRRMQGLGLSPQTADEGGGRGGDVSPRDEGDQAQASEREDIGVLTRERLATRINQLSAALRRIDEGMWGTCEDCGRRIERERLRALPEATTCVGCQRAREGRAA